MNTLEKAVHAAPAWRDAFRAASLRTGFSVHMTQPMLEFLAAVADGVEWDRGRYPCGPGRENFIATAAALVKRGLIAARTGPKLAAYRADVKANPDGYHYRNQWALTPAGECVVRLVKLAGLYVEADAALEKKARRRGRK